ncbi:MAG: hypothetical protein VST68_02530 [Nitrospirota bacterium]|nr:hypothetical protein [Nitrospirota bacterium]
MARMRVYKWWILVALCVIGLTWLPVYGIEKVSPGTQDGKGTAQTTDAHSRQSKFLDHDSTAEAEDAQVKSPEMTLVQQLEARVKELDERDQVLASEEQRLETLRQDFEALAREHARAIAEAAKFREANKEQKKIDPTLKSLAHLIKVYDAMDSEEAAVRLEKMKEPLALEILAGIKEKKAASMLAGVEPGKAARLSEGLRNFGSKKKTAKP